MNLWLDAGTLTTDYFMNGLLKDMKLRAGHWNSAVENTHMSMTMLGSRNEPKQEEDAVGLSSACQILRHCNSLVKTSLQLTS